MEQSSTRWSRITERLARPRPGVTILWFETVHSKSFADQVTYIAQHARVITLDEAVRGLSREDPAVGNSVVFTFDDGPASFSDVVLPVLMRHHLPATLYVGAAFVEEQRALPSGFAPMSWSAVGEAAASGLVTIGSHIHGRRQLDRAATPVATDDLRRSIDLLAARLGRPPLHFAYPDGQLGASELQRLVEERFHSAAAGRGRLNSIGRTDVHRLARVPVSTDAVPAELDLLVRPIGRLRG